MATKTNARDVTVFSADVGEPRDGYQDVVSLRLHYFDGRGYQLLGRVYRRELVKAESGFYTAMAFLGVTGITTRAVIEPAAKRFNARKLAQLAASLQDSEVLLEAVRRMKEELARRIVTGEDY